jgi:hypothetical protein
VCKLNLDRDSNHLKRLKRYQNKVMKHLLNKMNDQKGFVIFLFEKIYKFLLQI